MSRWRTRLANAAKATTTNYTDTHDLHPQVLQRYNHPMMKRSLLVIVSLLLLAACTPYTPPPPSPSPAPVPTEYVVPRTNQAPTDTTKPTPIPIGAPRIPTPAPAAEFAAIAATRRLPRDPIALARAFGVCRSDPLGCPAVVATTPPTFQIGEVQPFSITDMSSNEHHTIQAELRYIGPVALMYVEQGLPYNQADLERAAQTFETTIYPHTRAIFGTEAQPGVNGDTHVTILNARDPSGGILGYYSSQDALPRQINRFSNERTMFFMNGELLNFAAPDYLDVLAHEFQHMIHQTQQPGSATWFNEGCAQLAEDLNGFTNSNFPSLYLANPDDQLTEWAASPKAAAPHYGASLLFMRYIHAQYAGNTQIHPLILADAGNNLAAFVALAAQTRPDLVSFSQIVGDWAVANLLDDPTVGDGRYSYAVGDQPSLLPEHVTPMPLADGGSVHSDVTQYGADYFALPAGTRQLTFEGATTVGVAAVMPHGRFAWWSNRSDDSFATLTHAFDLRNVPTATLSFATWYEIEDNYDYAFVSISTDGGTTWTTLPGTLTTTADPQGVNYGNGITGVSGQSGGALENDLRGRWVTEQMNLTPYVGQAVLLRFWQINDEAFNAPGMLVDDLQIPELGYSDDVESGDGGWQAEGFARLDGHLPQRWEVRLVRTVADGSISVEPLTVDAKGTATATLAANERGVLVVLGATPSTSERATYTVSVQ